MNNDKTMDEILAELEPRRAGIVRHSFGIGVEKQTLTAISRNPEMSGAAGIVRPQAVQLIEADALRRIWAFGNLDRFFDLVKAGRPDGKLKPREENLYERYKSLPPAPGRFKRRPMTPFNQAKTPVPE